MSVFKAKNRVYVPAHAVFGVVTKVVPKAEGEWAEQFYEVKLDGNDLFEVTLQEQALHAADEAPDWSGEDLPADHPANGAS